MVKKWKRRYKDGFTGDLRELALREDELTEKPEALCKVDSAVELCHLFSANRPFRELCNKQPMKTRE